MAFYGKEYTFAKEENFKEFIDAIIKEEETAKKFAEYKPNLKLEQNGDTYKLFIITADSTKEISFKNGETVDEVIGGGKLTAKTTFKVDGNTLVQHQDFGDKGSITYKREYDGNDLKLTITCSKWDGVAYRWYTAL